MTTDYAALSAELTANPVAMIESVSGAPPSSYTLLIHVAGIHRTDSGGITRASEHRVRVDLPLGYPRQPPLVTAVSPIFHPNVAQHMCVADEWSPTETLLDVVVRVVDLIQFATLNLDSPLDPLAATYVRENEQLFPLGTQRLLAPDIKVELLRSLPTEDPIPKKEN